MVARMTGFRDVCFSYGKRRILNKLSFTAQPGECVVLAGSNGSGKSTALSILAGVLRADAGEVLADGPVGFVPQGIALFEDMSVGENLRFFTGLTQRDLFGKLPFGVEQLWERKVSKLSGGMKKRVSIAAALLGFPGVLLLDEPCASLDVEYREELTQLLLDLKEHGCTILYASHDPLEVAPVYDKLVFLGETSTVYTRAQLSGEPADTDRFCRNFTQLFCGKIEKGE